MLKSASILTFLVVLVVGSKAPAIERRQESQFDRLGFCYGEGSICSISNDLYSQCDAYDNDYENLIPWYKCLCTNGYVAVNQACAWCQIAYDLDLSYAGNTNTEGCSSASVSIAPIPASVLRAGSSYNTGAPTPGDAIATPADSTASTTASDSSSPVTQSDATTTSRRGASTYFGGSTAVATFSGGAVPTAFQTTEGPLATVTNAPATSSTQSSDGVAARYRPVAMLLLLLLCLCVCL